MGWCNKTGREGKEGSVNSRLDERLDLVGAAAADTGRT